MSAHYPDPCLSASLFAAGHLDALFAGAVAPAVAALEEAGDGADLYVWTLRYGRRGDHLKIRLHGPSSLAERFRLLLEEHSASCLERLPSEDGPGKKLSSKVPIDAEDGSEEPRERGLYLTTYRRSHVCLGERVLHADDAYCAALTRCLGRGASMLFGRVEEGSLEPWSHGARFNLLLKAVADGLGESGFDAGERRRYLTYHRDWLLRYTAGERDEEEARRDACELFDRRVAKMADGGAKVSAFVRGRLDGVGGGTVESGWAGDLRGALGVLAPLADEHAGAIDPYAGIPVFSPLFKIFQGLANQCGLNLAEEAYVYHLLLHAHGDGEVSS